MPLKNLLVDNTIIDEHISKLQKSIAHYLSEIEEAVKFLKKIYVDKNNFVPSSDFLEELDTNNTCVQAQAKRINTLIKIKDNNKITVEELQHLIEIPQIAETDFIKNYSNLESEHDSTRFFGVKK